MKKIIYILSVLFLSLLTIPALAYDVMVNGLRYELHSNGTAEVVSRYFDNYKVSGSITIPEEIKVGRKVYRVTSIGDRAFSGCKSLMSVTIPNTVTRIGESAFFNCESLMSVILPNSLQSIGAETFYSCKSLENIVIPNSVTFIGVNAFEYCSSLKTITIPFSTSLGNGVFKDCRALSKIIVSSDSYYTSSSLKEKYSSAILQIDPYSSRSRNVAIELATTNKSGNQSTINNNVTAQSQSSANNNSSGQNNSTINSNNSGNQKDSEFTKQLRLAEQGSAIAQNYVGWCYENGKGVAKNYSEAYKWYKKSADQGNAAAQNNVGRSYWNGRGVEQNYKEAFKWYMKAAEQGHMYAQNSVGYYYGKGIGVAQNYSEAFKWYKKSAEQGYTRAQIKVGDSYYYGNGIEQDYKIAFQWYMKAAEQGYSEGQYIIGLCYDYGRGVEQNYSEAFRWYMKAAEQGHSDAYNQIAYLYMAGNGVKKDEKLAFEMMNKAIELSPDDPDYYDSKGELYSMIGDKDHAMEMWNKIMSLDPKYSEDNDTNFITYIRRLSDGVDIDIPQTNYSNNITFAVIIANESYNREANVQYAISDGEIFSEYCSKTLGIPDRNIHLIKNATFNDIRHEVNWVTSVMKAYDGEAKAIFYYAGHGIPDERTKTACLLPVDGYGSDVTTGYPLSDLYSTLGGVPSKSVIVFLDACFSGAKRDGTMLASSRGIAIKVNQEDPVGSLIVFSASQGNETAFPYVEQGHGMFTYFILKKLQETKGNVTMGELSDYVTTQVKRESIVINNKSQTPIIFPAPKMSTSWRTETLK